MNNLILIKIFLTEIYPALNKIDIIPKLDCVTLQFEIGIVQDPSERFVVNNPDGVLLKQEIFRYFSVCVGHYF